MQKQHLIALSAVVNLLFALWNPTVVLILGALNQKEKKSEAIFFKHEAKSLYYRST